MLVPFPFPLCGASLSLFPYVASAFPFHPPPLQAIGYFKKQGFKKTLALPQSTWKGYIKARLCVFPSAPAFRIKDSHYDYVLTHDRTTTGAP